MTGIDSRIDGQPARIGTVAATNDAGLTGLTGTTGSVRAITQTGSVSRAGPLGLSWLGEARLGRNNTRVHRVDWLPRCRAVQATEVTGTGAISRETARRPAQPRLPGGSRRIDRVLRNRPGLRLRLSGRGHRTSRGLGHGPRLGLWLRLRSRPRGGLRNRAGLGLRLGRGPGWGLWSRPGLWLGLRLRRRPCGGLRRGPRLRLGCGSWLTTPTPSAGSPVALPATGTVAGALGHSLGDQ